MPAQNALARAGEDADRQLVVGVELVERRGDPLGDRAVDRVARVGPVEGDEQDAVAALGEDSLVGHAREPTGACRIPSAPRDTLDVMRFLHTADWHLGRAFHRVNMLGAQAGFIDHLRHRA